MFSKFWRHDSKGNGHWSDLSASPVACLKTRRYTVGLAQTILKPNSVSDSFTHSHHYSDKRGPVQSGALLSHTVLFVLSSGVFWLQQRLQSGSAQSDLCINNSTSHLHILTAKCFSSLYVYNHSFSKLQTTQGPTLSNPLRPVSAYLCMYQQCI